MFPSRGRGRRFCHPHQAWERGKERIKLPFVPNFLPLSRFAKGLVLDLFHQHAMGQHRAQHHRDPLGQQFQMKQSVEGGALPHP